MVVDAMKSGSIALAAVVLFCLGPAPSGAGQPDGLPRWQAPPEEPIAQVAAAVRELKLGEGEFVIGANLSEAQLRQAQDKLLDDTYPGTIKFPSQEVVVVADEKTNMILAIYQLREDVVATGVQQMIGHLMTRFGEPTSVAHDKLIYWAYGSEGKIAEQTFQAAKTTGTIDILATVKFSSTLTLSPGMGSDEMKETGTIYYIITSDRLLNRYITRQ